MKNQLEVFIKGNRIDRNIYLTSDVDEYNATYILDKIHAINREEVRRQNELQNELVQIAGELEVITGDTQSPEEKKKAMIKFKGNEIKPINLHISSRGGEVLSGLMIVDAILTSEVPVYAYIHNAHSMASVIAMVCDLRIGYPTTTFMIHDISYGEYGKFEEHLNRFEVVAEMKRKIKYFAMEYSEIPEDIYDEKLKGKDWYLNKREMDKYNIIDEIANYKKFNKGGETSE